ncbi:hypothetical protein CEUSTIGMA_g3083.t1 [Chlamydomonas eustigma]|uniref:PWWP domain-containing protein n=1 Tax=Chlamydomonas eustigma TaxID=1157962 RepID=A0A250WY70_9CHLO|nr:hypothetical protein CEUSTIGMA_g3083.t1 [Chlamydomonas eustigma]|eukprot:GAX75639.1 hypothetical protein CEUSTIGMA_g3083.t1 [Chlamydomonas eustigma]
MPHVTKSSKRVSELHPGDLVWAKISGFPAWPGQILPDDKATPKQLRSKKPGSLFVAFFGDSSHAWNLPGELDRFEDEYDRNKAQSCIKNREKRFITAVEEAKEVWDKRNGRRPAINHGAFDFLDCSTWPEHWLGTSEEVPVKAHWIPEDPSHTQLRAISTASAIQWLRRLAASPLSVLDNNFGIKRDHGPTISLIWSLGDSRCLKLDPATGQLLPTEAPSSTTADNEKSAPRLKKKLIEKVSTVSDPVQMKGEDGCKNDSDGTKKARPAVKLAQENKIQKRPDSEEASTPNAKKRAKVRDASAAAAPASVVKVLDKVTEEDITADLAALRAGGDSSLLNLAMFGGEIPGMLAPKDVMDACKQLAGDPIHWAAAITSEDSKTFENKGEKVQKILAASAAYFRYRELRNNDTGYYLPPRGEIGHVARAALEEVGAIPEAYGVESRKKITDLIARLNQQKSEETHMPWGIRDVADEVPPMVHGSGAGSGGGGEQNNVLKKARRKSAASESRKNALKVLQESRCDILVDSGVKVGSSERRCKPKLVGNEDDRKADILLEADELSDISEPDEGPSSSSESLPEEQEQDVERFSRQGANSTNGQHKPAAMSYIKKYDYIHLPAALASKESFLTAYQKFYGNSGREMPTDSSIHAFEPYEVFCAVAKEGGYEAVTESHGWRKLTCSWRPSMAANKQCGQNIEVRGEYYSNCRNQSREVAMKGGIRRRKSDYGYFVRCMDHEDWD